MINYNLKDVLDVRLKQIKQYGIPYDIKSII